MSRDRLRHGALPHMDEFLARSPGWYERLCEKDVVRLDCFAPWNARAFLLGLDRGPDSTFQVVSKRRITRRESPKFVIWASPSDRDSQGSGYYFRKYALDAPEHAAATGAAARSRPPADHVFFHNGGLARRFLSGEEIRPQEIREQMSEFEQDSDKRKEVRQSFNKYYPSFPTLCIRT